MTAKKILDRDEAVAALQAIGTGAAGEIAGWLEEDEYEGAEVDWYEGDVELDELAVPDIAVVVGNLRVKGLLRDSVDVDAGFIGVTGDVQAANIMTHGRMLVGGTVSAEELLYGNSLNDYWLQADRLAAKVIAENGHHMTARVIEASVCFRFMNSIEAKEGSVPSIDLRGNNNLESVAKEFIADVVGEDGGLDEERLREVLSQGRSALRS